MKIEIPFQGHKNILSLHQKTLEITKDDELTSNGDCIVGVSANISCVDLPEKMKKKIRNPKTKITFSIRAGNKKFTVQGIDFLGTQEAAPCYWMNGAVAPGAEDAMKGRGGLRAKILTSGVLRKDNRPN